MLKVRSTSMVAAVAMILFAGAATPVQANSLNTEQKIEISTHRYDSLAWGDTPGQGPVDFFATSTISRTSMSTEKNQNNTGTRVIMTQAHAGEGVIRIVTRICGTADNWRSIAADNGIKPGTQPPYLVHLNQDVSVNCESETAPDPVPQPAAPAPQAPAPAPAVVQAASGWTHPIPGACFPGGGSGFRTSARPSHDGVDIGAGFGTPLRAAAAGTVSTAWDDGAGNYTLINHGGGIATVYMHQSSFAVYSGWVDAGQVIGYVGSTGNSSGPHLHFEVHTGGPWSGKVDPVSFLGNRGVSLWC